MERSENARKKTRPSVLEETAKPADVVHAPTNWLTAICGADLKQGVELGVYFTLDNARVTCMDCRQKLGLRLDGTPESSGVDLLKLEQQSILRNKAANTEPSKGK